jgi:catechol 2,3-dioxygenase-like lactoylglutathione lyase family enzyme
MERAVPILPVDNLATAKAFYVDKLGFHTTFEVSHDSGSGLLGIERGNIQITLDCPMSGHGRNACVALQVDDADAYHREWHAKADVLRAPKNEDWRLPALASRRHPRWGRESKTTPPGDSNRIPTIGEFFGVTSGGGGVEFVGRPG